MAKNINIKDLFLDFQEEMKVNLKIVKKHLDHPDEQGGGTEKNWIIWLRKYLPERYRIDSARVIDCEGKRSDQIDIVIYDRQYSPFVFNKDGILYIPAESVYAVFEVKPHLSKANLNYAAKKISSVRLLKRTSAKIVHAGGEITTPKKPFNIIGGVLTIKSKWKPALGEPFEKLIRNYKGNEMIDIGCTIAAGSFLVKLNNGQTMISKSTDDEILIFFFLNLLMELQRLGTVPAMDIMEYAKALSSI